MSLLFSFKTLPIAIILPIICAVTVSVLLKGENKNSSFPSPLSPYSLYKSIIGSDGCNKYLNYEKTANCGPLGYLVQYGHKNCRKFTDPETHKKYSPIGVEFNLCTTECLLNRLDKLFKDNSPSCEQIKDSSFDSHIDCYLECNFCKVCKTEKLGMMRSYDYRDFLSSAAIVQVWKIVKACGVTNCFTY